MTKENTNELVLAIHQFIKTVRTETKIEENYENKILKFNHVTFSRNRNKFEYINLNTNKERVKILEL